jgi:hypothetical protein
LKGKLIVIEGLDASGKQTQTKLVTEKLKEMNYNVMQVSFPDYESNSSALVKMYLNGNFGKKPSDVNAFAASVFYTVDRFASFKTSCFFSILIAFTGQALAQIVQPVQSSGEIWIVYFCVPVLSPITFTALKQAGIFFNSSSEYVFDSKQA